MSEPPPSPDLAGPREQERVSVPPSGQPIMSRRLTLLFAVAGGAAVGNLYWAQPLLDFIARDLHASPAAAGWLVTATQLGYAAGILLVVPLGDVLDRRRLIPLMMLGAAVASLCAPWPRPSACCWWRSRSSASPRSPGSSSRPLAGDLADDAHRGRVVGTVVSGILIGILLSRTISGLVAGVAGWRAIYGLAAVVGGAVRASCCTARSRRCRQGADRVPALIASVVHRRAARADRPLDAGPRRHRIRHVHDVLDRADVPAQRRRRSPTRSRSSACSGWPGSAGAVAAQRSGRLHDRGWSLPATGTDGAGPDTGHLRRRGLRGPVGGPGPRRGRRPGRRPPGRRHPEPAARVRRVGRGPEPAQHRLRHVQLPRRRLGLRSCRRPLVSGRLDGGHRRGRRPQLLRSRRVGRWGGEARSSWPPDAAA